MAKELYNSELGTIVKFQDSQGTGEFVVCDHEYSGGKYITALMRKTDVSTPARSSGYYTACTSLINHLNETYYESIEEKVKKKIVTRSVPCADSSGSISYYNWKVYVASGSEMGAYHATSTPFNPEGSTLRYFTATPYASIVMHDTYTRTFSNKSPTSVILIDFSDNNLRIGSTPYRNVRSEKPLFWVERGLTIEDDGTLSVMTPTVPPSISFGNPISGKSLTVSWGKSTFSTSSIYYELEYQVDSGVWTSAGSATTLTSKSVIIPSSGTKINFRVRARSVYNDYSDYRTGVAKNIIYNQSPSVPSSISFDDPKAGKSININCGESKDPEGDIITYVFERQIDSGSWTQVSATYNRTITDTIPGSGTYVNYRVKVRDVYGSESSYRTGVKKEISYLPDITNPGIPTYKYPIPGRKMKVSWGASAVEDGSPVTYVIESLISDGSWSEIGQTQETFLEVDIPVVDSHGKTITIRVKATFGEEITSEYSTGKKEEILYHKVIRLIPWDFGTPFKARQFTKNERGQFQTLFKGSIAEYIPTGNLRLGDMPVGTLVRVSGNTIEDINWKLADQNHPGYPENSTTLITDKIIRLMGIDAKEPSNSDANRQRFGNNRYIHANITQWLNSNATAGQWYSAQHSQDAPPTIENVWNKCNAYDTLSGFLSMLNPRFTAKLLDTTLTVSKAEIDGGASETFNAKMFLASTTEVGFTNENGIAEGFLISMFSDNIFRIGYPSEECVLESDYKQSTINTTTGWYWWLRTPKAEQGYYTKCVKNDGTLEAGTTYAGDRGIRPLCNISADTMLNPNPNPDGSYNIVWE